MKRLYVLILVVGTIAGGAIVLAQGPQSALPASAGLPETQAVPALPTSAVPPFLPFYGVVLDPSGKPISGRVEITLAIYSDSEGGTPLWSEVQTVKANREGQYSVTLGAATSTGIPVTVFASGGMRWLGVSPAGQEELPRTSILTVPYALKASDADTLGGKPASAFLEASAGNTITAAAAPSAPTSGTLKGSGTANFISKFLDPSTIGNSIIFENGGKIGVGTTTPGATFDVNATGTTAAVSGFNSNGMGVVGNGSDAGIVGISFTANPSGVGVRGQGSATTGPALGVQGTTFSTSGTGVYGSANPTTGINFGVQGVVNSSGGIGISGQAVASSGSTIGVRGLVNSVGGAAGVFDNTAGGSILFGRVNGVDKFRVDGTGAVYATSYKDLAGNPIASGDITGVAAGTGLSGGGLSGDVTLSLNTGFTDARYASLTANTFTATQTINTGNLDLDPSTATTGNITKNGAPFLHNFGVENTFLGLNAGNLSTTGDSNTANGSSALKNNTSGNDNTAHGAFALTSNTTGNNNSAIGRFALFSNSTGQGNTASGTAALGNNNGANNTAVGLNALVGNTTGSSNVAVGSIAGVNATTGSNNIYLGASVVGVADESNTIYLGAQGTQTKTVIAGIRGTTVTGGEAVLIDANGRLGSGAVSPGANTVGSAQVIDDSLTASDLAPSSVTTSELAASSVTADKVAFNYAGSTSQGGAATDVACLGCVGASEVSFSYASLGANTFTGTQTIDTGNLDLDSSTATTGNITKNGTLFIHNFGSSNTFVGLQAGNVTMTGSSNLAVGNTTLVINTTGSSNTAIGGSTLNSNTTGSFNTATGQGALVNNSTGFRNTAHGTQTLFSNMTGGSNVAVGFRAGLNATGSNNIYLGPDVQGVTGESNTIYLGSQGTQTKTVIAGIRGTTVTGGEAVLIDANGRLGSGPVMPGTNTVGSNEVIDDSLTANDLAANSVGTSELANGSVTAGKVGFNYAGSISQGGPASDVACLGCISASEVNFSFASLGANTFSGTETIDGGNIDLDASTATTGNITKDGSPFLHNFGSQSVFLGENAGNLSMTGAGNTAIGWQAFRSNTSGVRNTSVGLAALSTNTLGNQNTAVGAFALAGNTSGVLNVAVGEQALSANATGANNIAVGMNALRSHTASDNNIAIGRDAASTLSNGAGNVIIGTFAGQNLNSGSLNLYISNEGVGNESNTIRIGEYFHARTFIDGIRGVTTGIGDAVSVVIDSAGQLGTISSSRRFKEDIRDMADTSRRLFQLRPVTFRYKQAYGDGSKPLQYGLIAEEVAEAFPELAVRNSDGSIETVHYETLSVLLLNELQRQEQQLRQQLDEMQRQRERFDALERRLNQLIKSR